MRLVVIRLWGDNSTRVRLVTRHSHAMEPEWGRTYLGQGSRLALANAFHHVVFRLANGLLIGSAGHVVVIVIAWVQS